MILPYIVSILAATTFILCSCNSIIPNDTVHIQPENQLDTRSFIGCLTVFATRERRDLIRRTYLQSKPVSIDFYFILGRAVDNVMLQSIEAENSTHRDLITLDIEENMNRGKTYAFFKYVTKLGAYDFIFKLDDDVYLNMANVEDRLKFLNRTATYYGTFITRHYGVFACGFFYGFSSDLVTRFLSDNNTVQFGGGEDFLASRWVQNSAKNRLAEVAWFYGRLATHGLKDSNMFVEVHMRFMNESHPYSKVLSNYSAGAKEYVPYLPIANGGGRSILIHPFGFAVTRKYRQTFVLYNNCRYLIRDNEFEAVALSELFLSQRVLVEIIDDLLLSSFKIGDSHHFNFSLLLTPNVTVKKCEHMQSEFDVIPNESWGRLPSNLQKIWNQIMCNKFVQHDNASLPSFLHAVHGSGNNVFLIFKHSKIVLTRPELDHLGLLPYIEHWPDDRIIAVPRLKDGLDSVLLLAPIGYYTAKPDNPISRNETKMILDHQSQVSTLKYFLNSGRCQHIYLDVGTNRGIQLRKLYEPQYYPGAQIHRIFDKYYGTVAKGRRNVCAIGFEPNPIHSSRMNALQLAYQKAGYPMVIFTQTAVGNADGSVTFFRDMHSDAHNHEWGGSLIDKFGGNKTERVLTMNMSQFLFDFRSDWKKSPNGSIILAKIDIEGKEDEFISDMIDKKSICEISVYMIEWHRETLAQKESILSRASSIAGCSTISFLDVDDELYGSGIDRNPYPS